MPVGYLSGGTTVFSNVSLGDEGRLAVSRLSSSASIVANHVWGSVVSGVLQAQAGTAAGPSVTFGGDTDTGMYSFGANQLGFATGGIARISVSTNGGGTIFVIRGGGANAVAPTFTTDSDQSLGWYRSGASTIALSYGTLNLFTQSVRLSKRTAADATGLNIGELAVVFAASGISLVYSSGASYYIIGGSAVSAAQA